MFSYHTSETVYEEDDHSPYMHFCVQERLLSEVDSIEKKYKRILEMQGNSRTFGLDLNATDVVSDCFPDFSIATIRCSLSFAYFISQYGSNPVLDRHECMVSLI